MDTLLNSQGVFLIIKQGAFLMCSVFDRASCLHLLSDFVHLPLIFGRIGAIERGIDHDFIIKLSQVISQSVTGVFLVEFDNS